MLDQSIFLSEVFPDIVFLLAGSAAACAQTVGAEAREERGAGRTVAPPGKETRCDAGRSPPCVFFTRQPSLRNSHVHQSGLTPRSCTGGHEGSSAETRTG